MNMRRFVVAVLAIFIFALVWNWFVHMMLLEEASRALENVVRPATERSMVLGLLLTAGVATLFVYSYLSFVRTPGIRRALGDGVFFAVAAGLFVDLNQVFLYPIPGSLALAWFLFGFNPASAIGHHMFRVADWPIAVIVSVGAKDLLESKGVSGLSYDRVD